MGFGAIKNYILGHPLSNEMAIHERIPKWKALAVLSSDALSSVAYATEEVLIPLAAFSVVAVSWSMPIALVIATLLVIITASYRQTIEAYPGGGGAYTVAKENLGTTAGLVAAGSLLIDYVLTVAVSIASGVENIASAFPALQEHRVALGAAVIVLIGIFNLRGVRESANVFAVPTYLFILSIVVLIGSGVYRIATGSAAPAAPIVHETYPALPLFLLLRAFSSGCVAITGIEAISNGVPVFREPSSKNAKATMVWMSLILGSFFIGITLLAHLYGIVPQHGETAVSLLARSVFGEGFFYYGVQASTALILVLAANTSFADFPRLSSLLAKDRFLPRQMAMLGDRLVFSNGILLLVVGSISLIVLFKGATHHLIPLYAVGVFLSFTLSQLGMVVHHLKERQAGWIKSIGFNAVGAVATGVVLVVVASTKFVHGAWMVIVLIPLLVLFFRKIHDHYLWIAGRLAYAAPEVRPVGKVQHTVIVPVSGLHAGVIDALRYARTISDDVRACYVELDPEATERMKEQWNRNAREFPFVVLKSPYRSVIQPILEYIDDVRDVAHGEFVTVVIPEFITPKWYHHFLHNQTALFLRAALRLKKDTIVTSVRYHLT